MLLRRVLVVVVLLPVGIAAISAGGWLFAGMMALILGAAAWEYAQLFKAGGLQPAGFLVVAGAGGLTAARQLGGFAYDAWLIPLFVLLSMTLHLIDYERGRDLAASDFAVTVAGIFYMGLLGSYFVPLRALPEGQWWLLLVLPSVWLADSGAYFIGTRFGKHKMTPRLSPKKSWEGYFGGILVGAIGTPLLVLLYRQLGLAADSAITFQAAIVIGLVMGVFPTLGDLGESMIKRQMGVKDSGALLPGHGGAFDRIDSWLWAGVLGYYLVLGLVR